ncbi:MAG: enoyl-CoA hydratase/isomerase family protein [Trueperaceae bacterium]|nr:MAG: enoyl-CoA hydratase/isomerase family protein [Trueperaceae bacterium]
MGKNVLVDFQDGVLQITMNRPEVLNALSLELLEELRHEFEDAAQNPEVRAVLFSGSGRGFCAGADLTSTRIGGDVGEVIERYYNPVVRAIVGMPKPVLAAVNGVASGAGLSLALACDMRLLSSSAVLTLGFTGIGLVMDAGCSYFLPRLIGRGRAFELAYSGRRIEAEEAKHLGLGEVVLEADSFSDDAWAYTRRVAMGPTLSFASVKEQLNRAEDNDFEVQLALEVKLQRRAVASEDAREGMAAFLEKRLPKFCGK